VWGLQGLFFGDSSYRTVFPNGTLPFLSVLAIDFSCGKLFRFVIYGTIDMKRFSVAGKPKGGFEIALKLG
jgi:hypothetical protein